MVEHFRAFYQFRELFWSWTIRELKIRYKQSLLGGLWAILQPLLLTILFVIVFSIFMRLPTDEIPYPVFAYTALLPWTYFATGISFGVPSMVNNMTLVTKIYFPREIIPLASIAVALVDLCIAASMLVLLLLYYQVPFHTTIIWVPVLVVVQTIFMAGVVLVAAALNAFYRDIRFVVPLGIQAWMYATPVIYPLSVVPEWLRPFYLMNPMAGLIDGYRRTILKGLPPDPIAFGIASTIAVLVFLLGYRYFKHAEAILPDVI